MLGICNGFQVLTEARLLPGALMRNAGISLRLPRRAAEGREQPVGLHRRYAAGEEIVIPVAHHDGNYQADAETLDRLEGEGRVAFRYAGECNGSARDIAGILNEAGNVLGMMPHPERAVEAGARPHRRPAAVRGPAGGGQPGGLTFNCLVYSKPAYYMRAAMENFAFEVAETARLIRREANRRAAVLGATKAQWRVLARLNLSAVACARSSSPKRSTSSRSPCAGCSTGSRKPAWSSAAATRAIGAPG